MGHVGDIADTPKGRNAIFVGDVGEGYYQDGHLLQNRINPYNRLVIKSY